MIRIFLATAATTAIAFAVGVLFGNPYFAAVGLLAGLLFTFVEPEMQPKYSQYALFGVMTAMGVNILALLLGAGIPYISEFNLVVVCGAGALMGVAYYGTANIVK